MDHTPNYNFNLPTDNDNVDVSDLDANFTDIDSLLFISSAQIADLNINKLASPPGAIGESQSRVLDYGNTFKALYLPTEGGNPIESVMTLPNALVLKTKTTLLAANWVGDNTVRILNYNIGETDLIAFDISKSASAEQYTAMKQAGINGVYTSQQNGSCNIKVNGIKPTINIPIDIYILKAKLLPDTPSPESPTGAIAAYIITNPTGASKIVGNSVTFTVLAGGDSPLSYQWRKNGSNISGATNPSYTITNLQTNDAGNYTCYVSNSAGNVTSNVATLSVSALVPKTITVTNIIYNNGIFLITNFEIKDQNGSPIATPVSWKNSAGAQVDTTTARGNSNFPLGFIGASPFTATPQGKSPITLQISAGTYTYNIS